MVSRFLKNGWKPLSCQQDELAAVSGASAYLPLRKMDFNLSVRMEAALSHDVMLHFHKLWLLITKHLTVGHSA